MAVAISARTARYVGVCDWWGRHVWLERGGVRASLPYRGDGVPVGFAWARRGLGARELARSILHDVTGSAVLAERLCRDFTLDVVAELPEVSFELDRDEVLSWLAAQTAAA
jgi:hypothetical protein